MKQRIRLYIDGRVADCDTDALILMNYQQDDLDNPAAVKNSYSQAVTLPGTPANNAIFSSAFRLDRYTTGATFNAMRKTPFEIRNERSEVLERGYVKLDTIESAGGRAHSYKVHLYGGIGGLLYALSYDSAGNKRTLADLDFGVDLGFTINASTVAGAWAALLDGTPGKWSIVNFAPCYNGIPDNFDADKALVAAPDPDLGIEGSYNGVSAHNGFVLAQLDRDYTEAEMLDFRSYLQRPVISLKAVLDAICDPANNGGHSVAIDPGAVSHDDLHNVWLTLPLLGSNPYSRTINDTVGSTNDFDPDGWHSSTPWFMTYSGTSSVSGAIELMPQLLLATGHDGALRYRGGAVTVYVARGVDASNNVLWTSDAKVLCASSADVDPARLAAIFSSAGLAPGTVTYLEGGWSAVGGLAEWRGDPVEFAVPETAGLDRVDVFCYAEDDDTYCLETPGGARIEIGTTMADFSGTMTITEDGISSGRVISQQRLLAGTGSPADYLLAWIKMYGLNMVQDPSTGEIAILGDPDYYDGQVISLQDRVDLGKTRSVVPTAARAHWYAMEHPVAQGEKAAEYAATYGAPYGKMRINTGWEFDADEVSMLEGGILRGAVQVLAQGPQYNTLTIDGHTDCRWWQTRGYTLTYGAAGTTAEKEVPPAYPSAAVSFNDDLGNADTVDKPQFCGADGKGVDGANVLLYYSGFSYPSRDVFVTDDTAEMFAQNDNSPCWLVGAGTRQHGLPRFSRFLTNYGVTELARTLDFAAPREIYVPTIRTMSAKPSLYERYWQAWAHDRYDTDTQVVTLRVDWRGIRVDADLLRHFYFFGGSLWVLNKIINHSLTTDDPTECEFIRVQDPAAYTAGTIV